MTRFLFLFFGLIFAASTGAAAQVLHSNELLTIVQAPDERGCAFFQLEGVSEADPAVPGQPWFALPKTHDGYEMAVSLLITAKVSRLLVLVTTTGSSACGLSEVRNVRLE